MNCEALFQPITIGSMTLKNRIMLPGMTTRLCLDGGYVSDGMIAYYSRIARGGCGLIVVEATSVHAPTAPGNFLRICGDAYIPGLRKLAEAVHQEGGKISIQLWQGGFCATATDLSLPAIVPCDMQFRGMTFKGASKETLEEVAAAFGEAARRAWESGFDSVEFHCGHQYSPAHFLSGFNKREDEYGGSLENRARYPLECIRAIRSNVPEGFPVSMRVVAQDDYIEGGNTLEDTISFINMAEKEGVDFVNISRGNKMTAAFRYEVPSMYTPKQFNLDNVVRIKAGVHIPVAGGGRIVDPETAAPYVEDGRLDMIFVGRPQICDPDFCHKTREGRLQDLVRCLSCNQGCLDNVQQAGGSRHVTCLRNPFAGHELERKFDKTQSPKNVVVIGGGMGGMEAAYILHQKGHRAILVEEKDCLGGQFICAGQAPHKEVLAQAARARGEQILRSGVEVRLGVRADAALLEELKPDEVVIAAGASPVKLSIPGIKGENVYSHEQVLMGQTALSGEVAVIGGGLVGIECALYLADKGCQVSVVEMKDRIGADISGGQMMDIMINLQTAGIRQVPGALCKAVTEEGVVAETAQGETPIPGKSVVTAVGSRSVDHTWAEEYCRNQKIPCHIIGDAKEGQKSPTSNRRSGGYGSGHLIIKREENFVVEKISVVTGASGGMGYYTAKYAGERSTVLITDISADRVEKTLKQLREEGVTCEGMVADVSKREDVKALAEKANEMGQIIAVYSVAGLSPSNGFPGEQIMRTNAFSVVYVNEEFSKYMTGGCFLNVASSTAYMLPEEKLPLQVFDLALTDIEGFEKAMVGMSDQVCVCEAPV